MKIESRWPLTGAFLQLHVQNEYSVCRVFEPRALYLEPGALEPYIATLNIEDPPPPQKVCVFKMLYANQVTPALHNCSNLGPIQVIATWGKFPRTKTNIFLSFESLNKGGLILWKWKCPSVIIKNHTFCLPLVLTVVYIIT